MKKIVTCLALLAATVGAQAQGVEINIIGETDDVSGTIVEVSNGEASPSAKFEFKNVSGATIIMNVERIRIIELAGTADYLCWGLECYDEGFVSASDPFISPDVLDVLNDSSAVLLSYHETHDVAGCVQYRYFALDDAGTRLDSVDVKYCSTVSVDENEKFDISIYPNPVSEVLTVKLDQNMDNVGFELYNVLGDVVMTKNLSKGQNYLDVQALPNGVYFYAVMLEGNALETKKLVVRH
jgi:hypothetical protein